MIDMVPIIIPAYEPDGRLLTLLEKLSENHAGEPVIIIDDGSSAKYKDVFVKAEGLVQKMDGCIL